MAIKHEIRQSSVIQGNGPGSLTVLQEGLSVIIPGLDAWYRKDTNLASSGDGIPTMIRVQEIPEKCRIMDTNLASLLKVDYFAQPPAVGIDSQNKSHTESLNVSVFPCWSVCYNCRQLTSIPSDSRRLPFCNNCEITEKKKRKVVQVNFVTICESGHLDEFPWREWVHRSVFGGCPGAPLKMESRGSGDLKGQRVTCTSCNKTRVLAGANESDDFGGTKLSNRLDNTGTQFLCAGARPWLADNEPCGEPVRLILRNANNLYYSSNFSSILIPVATNDDSPIDELIDENYAAIQLILVSNGFDYVDAATSLWYTNKEFKQHDLKQLQDRLKIKVPNIANQPTTTGHQDTTEESLKLPEWKALTTPQDNASLVVRETGYQGEIFGFNLVHAVPTLRKTTALAGFSRLMPKPPTLVDGAKLLRRKPNGPNTRWLPATQYVGEGILIQLDETLLAAWENQPSLTSRVDTVTRNLTAIGRLNPDEYPSARRMLLHTLSHVLIQQLVVQCGYVAASLSERIYADENMAGILIYTASPDADGTLGGLVEMAETQQLKLVLENAIQNASWCSNDPVCMELGNDGQGVSGTNLAACHSCCLLPETSCDHFNQGLDRALLVGDINNPSAFMGFFDGMI